MANKRQKKKDLATAVKTIASYIEKFKITIEKQIKTNPYETRLKLLEYLENDLNNTWAWYFIAKCNEEIKRQSTSQFEERADLNQIVT